MWRRKVYPSGVFVSLPKIKILSSVFIFAKGWKALFPSVAMGREAKVENEF
ncbi:MAG: hypothetical protein IJ741_02315 [Schwartzia sp.]|nr:hypothetical protein [Schwartzia sp. (in: firmicutes)]